MDKELENIKEEAEKEGRMPDSMVSFLKVAEKKDGGGTRGLGPIKVKILKIAREERTPYKFDEAMDHLVLYVDHNGKKKQYAKPVYKYKERVDGETVVIPEEDREVDYLVRSLIDLGVDVGDEIILEYQKREDSFMGFIDVRKPDDEDDIPVIEEDEPYTGGNS